MSDPDDPSATDPDRSPSDAATGDATTDDAATDGSSESADTRTPGSGGTVESAGSEVEPSASGPSGSDADAAESGIVSAEDLEEVLDEETVGDSRRLDPKVRLYWVTSRVFGAVFLSVFGGFLVQAVGGGLGYVELPGAFPFGIAREAVLGAVGTFLLVGGVVVAHALLYYRSWRYEVRTDSLSLTRGVFTRVQTVAPYVRVQHIDTRRGPVERLLGLSTLVVYTAGSRGADVTVPGLTDERAAELQRGLKLLAIASEEEDAV